MRLRLPYSRHTEFPFGKCVWVSEHSNLKRVYEPKQTWGGGTDKY